MPLPCLTSPPVPVICEARVVLAALLVVSVCGPSAMIPPAPDSAPTVWLAPDKDMSKRPPLTVSAPVGASAPPTLSRNSVPALMMVPPV
jgi:hypothetical protein